MKAFFTIFFFVLAIGIANAQKTIITTVAGNGVLNDTGDGGLATLAAIDHPGFISFDSRGNYYISDAYASTIRKVNTTGIIKHIAGNFAPPAGYYGDGGLADTSHIFGPGGIAFDSYGNLYFADGDNNRIRKIDTSGIILTVAGTGTAGYNGDNISALSAELNAPYDVAIDKHGNIYFTDFQNQRVRRIDSFGIITTIAGTGINGYNGDGRGDTTKLNFPMGLTIDSLGNLFIADYGNHRVRKIDNSGIITTIAGTGTPGYNGDSIIATSAELLFPADIAIDESSNSSRSGNIYLVDQENQRIRCIHPSGIITTIAGNGTQGFYGDGGDAKLAEFHLPIGIALDDTGNIYIADQDNSRVRKITFIDTTNDTTNIVTLPSKSHFIFIAPNPAFTNVDLIINDFAPSNSCYYAITDVTGRLVKREKIITAKQQIDISNLQGGIYFIEVNIAEQRIIKKLIKE
jgi:sugar lactone lactonase YvrE